MNDTDDWYDVTTATSHSYRIVEGPYYGQFLIVGSERALVIDAGVGVGDLRGLVAELTDRPTMLLLTHWHWDHLGNAAQFEDVRVHPAEVGPDGLVAVDGLTDEFVDRPGQFLAEWQSAGKELPDGFDPETYAIDPVEPTETLTDGSTIDLGDRRLELLHTPGHSRGHLSAIERDAGVLYGGDVIHIDAGLYVHFEGSDLRSYRETLARLRSLRDDGAFDTLLTSHNQPFVGDDLTILDRLVEGIDRILDGTAEFELVETRWGSARRYEFGGSPVFTGIPE